MHILRRPLPYEDFKILSGSKRPYSRDKPWDKLAISSQECGTTTGTDFGFEAEFSGQLLGRFAGRGQGLGHWLA